MQVLAPVMVSTLSDDYDTSMRHLTCLAFRFLFLLLEGKLGEPQVVLWGGGVIVRMHSCWWMWIFARSVHFCPIVNFHFDCRVYR